MSENEEPHPNALTERHVVALERAIGAVVALERAIRAEGYTVVPDATTGAVRLTRGDYRRPLFSGKPLNAFAMCAALARIRAAARAVKGAENAAERLDTEGVLRWQQIEQICTDALGE